MGKLTIAEEVEKYLYRKAKLEQRAQRKRLRERREAKEKAKQTEQLEGQISMFENEIKL